MLNQLYILYLAALLMDMSVAGGMFAITRRAAELGASAFQLGLLGAALFAMYSVAALVAGPLSDRIGRRAVAVGACLVTCVLAMACAFILSMKLLVALSLLFGAAIGCFWPAIVAWIGEGLSGRALSRRVAGFCVSWNIGLLLGFALTGYVFERSPQLAFVIPSVTILVIAVLLQLPVRMAAAPVPTETAPADLIPKGRGFRKTAWLANFGANFATAAAMALFPQLATALDISADTHGVLLAVGRAAALATFVAMQLTAFWHTRLWPLWVAQAVGALGVALVAWGESTWVFALAFIIMGVLTGVSFQAAVFFTLEEMSEKGKGSGFNEAVVGSGLFLGPLLAGRVGDQFGQRAPYLFCGWVLVFLIAVQMALVRCRRRRTPR